VLSTIIRAVNREEASMTTAPPLPRPLPDADVLSGRTIDLERLDPLRHGPDLWRAIGSVPSLWQGVPPGPFADEAAFSMWLVERAVRSDQVLYALVDRRGTAEGVYLLINIEDAMGRIEMGLVLGARLSRTIAATEAFYLLGRYVFETLGYRRFEWRCSPENEASMRAAERFGFTLEGILRQNAWIKGRNWDTAVYAIIDSEWPANAARLTRWLAPENFTPDGRQVKPLR
jgi:RimJ/RimL family protein N-acetyltransferase